MVRMYQKIGFKKGSKLNIKYNIKMADREFNLEDSHDNIVPVDWLPRQKSNDSIFNDLIRVPSYGQRDLIFPYNPVNG